MVTIKKGRLYGIKYVVDENGKVKSAMVVKFGNNMYYVFLPKSNKSTFIKNFVDKFELGITNAKTFFNYVDFKNLISFKFNLYCDDDIYYKDVVKGFDKNIIEDILDIISAMEQNCNIINIGFTFCKETTNSLRIEGGIPKDFISSYDTLEIINDSPTVGTDFNGNAISFMLREELIPLRDNMVVDISNDWNNEDWNGPQSYGGFTAIKEYEYRDKGIATYDFEVKDIKNCVDYEPIFDENTIVSLSGNQSNGFSILLPLKKREVLSGLIGSQIFSGIIGDIESLFQLKYQTHKDWLKEHNYSSLNLLSIKEVENCFNEYDSYFVTRAKDIESKTYKMYGKDAKPSSNTNEDDLPFN